MAFNSSTHWEIRTTGSDANGGGFNTASTGTDYSQQDTPQVTYTDLVIDGTTNTKLTSAAHPFTSAHVGNIINITGGTGFTVQRVQITSVASGVATCDKSCGTLSSTGGTGNLGGGLATPALGFTLPASGNTVWVQSGTYNQSALISTPASLATFSIIGYATTHGDNGTAPVLNMTASSTVLLSITSCTSSGLIKNLSFTTSAATKSDCISNGGSSNVVFLVGLTITGFARAYIGESGIGGTTPSSATITDCAITGCTGDAISVAGTLFISNCYVYGNTGIGIASGASGTVIVASNTILANCSYGMRFVSPVTVRMDHCTLANNTNSGLSTLNTTRLTMRNCLLYGNGLWGADGGSATITTTILASNNAYGGNASGNLNFISAGTGDVVLTGNPFNGSTDFSLNSTAGAGGACKGAGYPGAFPGGTTVGHLDIGAVQSSGGSSAAGGYSYVFVT